MRHTKDWKHKIVRHLGMRAAWKVEWLREDLMDNVITKEESAPALAGAFLTLWKGGVVLRGEYTTRRILFWRENVENDWGMNYNFRNGRGGRYENEIFDKRTNEIKNAYSVEVKDEKTFVQFKKDGKAYSYHSSNIEIMDESQEEMKHRIYQFKRPCYKCGQATTIYTYITFSDNANEDVTFPWDKERLLRNQDIFAHLQDPSIEYYGLNVIGGIKDLDEMLLEKLPGKIKMQYSRTQNRKYPMNICEYCKAKQGEYFIYRCVNEMIKNMEEIEVLV